jgi:hypothetical protein
MRSCQNNFHNTQIYYLTLYQTNKGGLNYHIQKKCNVQTVYTCSNNNNLARKDNVLYIYNIKIA